MILKLWCWLRRKHEWRRARKGQDASLSYCKCGATRAVEKLTDDVLHPMQGMSYGGVIFVREEDCRKSVEAVIRRKHGQVTELQRTLLARDQDVARLEAALEEARRDLERMRKKFDQLLPGEHVWHSADALIKWPYCSICGVIRRADSTNSPCKGAANIALRNAALAKDS